MRKIEKRIDAGVDAIEPFASALEERNQRRIAVEHFTDHAVVRVFGLDGLRPRMPESARHVRQSVLPDAIQAGDCRSTTACSE